MNVPQTIRGYQLHEAIGKGGFGAVYRAYQSIGDTSREVAIKVITPQIANDPAYIRRFQTEVESISRLAHPFIVPLIDAWRDPSGAYLVMRLLDGGNLKDLVQAGPLELRTVAQILDQICAALATAHRNGVIHRDLKPSNILLDEDGNAYLADFGIAKSFHENILSEMTGPDVIVGTFDYIPPEQARRDPVTNRTDIYSLGAVLYEMLMGEHPFAHVSGVERIYKHLNDPLPQLSLSDVDPAVVEAINKIVQKATQKDPAHRYSDILEVASDFRQAAALDDSQEAANIVEQLTRREQDILRLIIADNSNKEIANELFLAMPTVKWYISRIYKKLGVNNRVQAIVRARDLHLIVSDGGNGADSSISMTFIPTDEFEANNPYKGLQAFQAVDHRDFFGREELTAKLIKRLGEKTPLSRFLAIVGPSGSGKSSLVKAGLVPAIWRGDLAGSESWYVVEMLPGSHPFDELEVALMKVAANQSENLHEQLSRDERGLIRAAQLIMPDDDSQLLLIIDQFEEVFTLVDDEEHRLAFLTLLHEAATDKRSRVRVIVTLRADFYDRPLQYPQFGDLMRNRMETVLPLSAEELERAIIKPAQRVGARFEEGLVAQISRQVAYQPGALPLLQYALTELFERREGRLLTQAAYQDIGGAVGALAKRADDLYHELNAEGQESVRQMFLRLVTLGEGTEDTRRRVDRSELLAITNDVDLMEDIINVYADYRLLSLDRDPATRTPTVEVAHEAILREWERLRLWLNESRDDVKMQRQLATLATAWQANNHDESYLVRGRRLEQFQLWSLSTKLSMTPTEMDFLSASLAAHEIRESDAAAQVAREKRLERRAYNRLRIIVAVLLIASAFGITLTIGIFLQRQSAIKSRDDARDAQVDAEREAIVRQSVALAANAQQALLVNDTDLAIALALEANAIDDPPIEAEQALVDAIYAPGTRRVFTGHQGPISSIAISPDGKYALSGGGLPLSDRVVGNEHLFANQYNDFSIRLWDLETGEEIRRFEVHTNTVLKIRFSADGNSAISASADNRILVWDIETGIILKEFTFDANYSLNAAGISIDNSMVIGGRGLSYQRVIEVATGNSRTPIALGVNGAIWDIAISPDNRYVALAVGGYGITEIGSVYVEDITSDRLYNANNAFSDLQERGIQAFDVTGVSRAITFTSDGRFLLFATMAVAPDTQGLFAPVSGLTMIDLETNQEVFNLYHGYSAITDIAVSPDGRTAVSVAGDQVIILWDLEFGTALRRFIGHNGWITSVEFTPDGRHILTGSDDGTIRLWDMQNGGEENHFETQRSPVHDVAFSPDGRFVAAGSMDNDVRVWNIETNEMVVHLRDHFGGIRAVAFIKDGTQLVSASFDGSIRFWDAKTGEQLQTLRNPTSSPDGFMDLALSPDGRFAVSANGAATIDGRWTQSSLNMRLWDLQTGTIIRQIIGHTDLIYRVTISPDGRYVLASSYDGTMTMWDLETGTLIRTFIGHSGKLFGVSFHPNGQYGLTSSEDRTLILWDLSTGDIIHQLEGHRLDIYDSAISPDGHTAISGGTDNTLMLWNLNTGGLIRRFQRSETSTTLTSIVSLNYSPDGRFAVTGGGRGEVVVWRLFDTADEIITWGQENRYIRDLTCAERERFNVSPLCEGQIPFPTRTPFPTPRPSEIPSATPTIDLTQNPATASWTPFPSPTILPSSTPVGNIERGELLPNAPVSESIRQQGDQSTTDRWVFSGVQGSIVTIDFQHLGLKMALLGPDGNIVEQTSGRRIGPVMLTSNGTYSVVISKDFTPGGYTVTLTIE